MDSGAAIVGLVIVLICAIPFILISINNRNKKKKLLDKIVSLATKHNSNINQYELWNNTSIGIDYTKQIVFYTSSRKEVEIHQQINLNEVQKCSIANSSRTVNNEMGNFNVVEKLELQFTFQNKTKADVTLEFYNVKHNISTLSGELQLIEKWNTIITTKIDEMRKQK
jgi:hypothetical protein